MKTLPSSLYLLYGLILVLMVAAWPATAKPGENRHYRKDWASVPPPRSETPVQRLHTRSPAYAVPPEHLALFMNYTGYLGEGETRRRIFHEEIIDKVRDMIRQAEEVILLSVFLFDNVYLPGAEYPDVAGQLTDLLIRQKQRHPDMTVAVILDPSNKAYAQRVSPAEQRLREAGIDVFYSDLISGLRPGSLIGVREIFAHTGRGLDRLTFNLWGRGWSWVQSGLKSPDMKFDEAPVSLETLLNAALIKANHRKLLVTDVAGEGLELMASTANPHNPSAYHVNCALTVRDGPATYAYNVLRADIAYSIGLGPLYTHWNDQSTGTYRAHYLSRHLPPRPLPIPSAAGPEDARVTFLSETAVRDEILHQLEQVQTGDEVRIQMFYLSHQAMLEAILNAATVTDQPVRLLLDANTNAFNQERDGTPNRQVARYLLREAERRGAHLAIRWYHTHGEQNHCKNMSITQSGDRRWILTTGSTNWTGRNLNGVNMEANLLVENGPSVTRAFNRQFDRFWENEGGVSYSLPYEVYREAAPDHKWRLGEAPYYYSRF